ncbi:MAG: MFS transporter [Bacillota bacterium]|nr:MFS transporter [Bacillota bacterium]
MKQHPLIQTLLNLRGNSKACVLTEPLWGIPYNLLGPYISVYMLALGVKDSQIGLIATIGMISQIIFSLLGGAVTDKLGRRYTTFIFDFICWTVPALIWAFSKNFYYFAAAAILNGTMRITMNSWNCLLVEDCDKKQIVNIYTWIYIAGLGAAFFSPLSSIFVKNYGMVPTVRVLYLIFSGVMAVKIYLTFRYTTETGPGRIRMDETKHLSLGEVLGGYGGVVRKLLKTPETLLTLGLMIVMSIINMVNSNFWSIAITERIHLPENYLGLFPFLKSIVMLILFFTVIPRINALRFKRPLVLGFMTFGISQLIVIFAPDKGLIFIIGSIILEACGISIISPLLDSLQVVLVDVRERARVMAVLYVIVLAVTSPFGALAGELSEIDRRLPFVLNIALLICGVILTYFSAAASRYKQSIKQ